MKTQINKHGYECIRLHVNGKMYSKRIHRLVAEAFVDNDNPDNFDEINHINGKKLENDMNNLEWIDRSGNMQHAYDTGLKELMKGEKHPNHKHTKEQILVVCDLMEGGSSNKEIHEKTGIKSDTLSNIRTGKSWTNVTEDYDFETIPHPNKRYTDKEIEDVCIMMNAGYNNHEISDALNISYNVVADIRRGRSWTHISNKYNIAMDGHPNREYTEDQIREACQLMENGMNNREISDKLDISYNVIADIRKGKSWKKISKDYNIRLLHEKVDKSEHWDKIDELLLQGYSRKEIRKMYPIPDLTKQQYITLIQNRVDHLKKEGKLN